MKTGLKRKQKDFKQCELVVNSSLVDANDVKAFTSKKYAYKNYNHYYK